MVMLSPFQGLFGIALAIVVALSGLLIFGIHKALLYVCADALSGLVDGDSLSGFCACACNLYLFRPLLLLIFL